MGSQLPALATAARPGVLAMVEAGHPVPDAAGLEAAKKMLALAQDATASDLVLVLISGGASANLVALANGVTLAEKQSVTRQLLECGASIGEINTLRKHLSAIKGGRLAARAYPARVLTLAISDVPGDDPTIIGSGPTVARPDYARRCSGGRGALPADPAGGGRPRAARSRQ